MDEKLLERNHNILLIFYSIFYSFYSSLNDSKNIQLGVLIHSHFLPLCISTPFLACSIWRKISSQAWLARSQGQRAALRAVSRADFG